MKITCYCTTEIETNGQKECPKCGTIVYVKRRELKSGEIEEIGITKMTKKTKKWLENNEWDHIKNCFVKRK